MNRREMIASLGTGFAVAGVGSVAGAAEGEHKSADAALIKTITDCMNECNRCADACFKEAAAGKKESIESGRSCADCADFCAQAVKMLARNSAYKKQAIKACAEVCEACSVSCAKNAACPHCHPCAKMCKECAEACRKAA